MNRLDELIGLIIKDINVAESKAVVSITTTDNRVAYLECEADCCSDTWIEHLEIPKDYEGATILSLDYKSMGDDDLDPLYDGSKYRSEWVDCELIQFYSLTLKTTKGDIDIEYRNSSNGYYGGSIYLSDIKVIDGEKTC